MTNIEEIKLDILLQSYLKTKLNEKILQGKFPNRNTEITDLVVYSGLDLCSLEMKFRVQMDYKDILSTSIMLYDAYMYSESQLVQKLCNELEKRLYKQFGIIRDGVVPVQTELIKTTSKRKPILCHCCGSPLQPPFNHCNFCGVFYEG
jgi:hypothetical protein